MNELQEGVNQVNREKLIENGINRIKSGIDRIGKLEDRMSTLEALVNENNAIVLRVSAESASLRAAVEKLQSTAENVCLHPVFKSDNFD